MSCFKCSKCGKDINFEPKDYKVAATEEFICSNCGAKYYVKNSPCPSFKEKLKNFGIGLGKLAFKAAEAGLDTLGNMQQEYNSAQSRLQDKNIDDWDEEKLKERLKYTGNTYEEMVIRQKLREKTSENIDED